MHKWVYCAALACAASPASAEKFSLDYELAVNAKQQRIDGVLQPLVQLSIEERRSYSGMLQVDFGGNIETIEDGPSFDRKVRVQSIAVTYDFFSLAPDLLPYSPAADLPAPTTRLESVLRLERRETNGVPDEGGAYRLKDLAWSAEIFSASFDFPTLTTRSVRRIERIFSFLPESSFRFGALDGLSLAKALEAAQYRQCGNFSCAFEGALAWQEYSGDESFTLGGRERGVADLFLGTMTFSNARAAVPEPASWGLLITGFGLAGAVARRRAGVTIA